ncbi:MAG: DUF2269 domain-containing protein [Caldilineales bacterium]|nr:DUF2269 domain-containing protein [Caldilineales bacterium]MCW5858910.1 DUF2269 family protein [Caldilineales bacterium]
MSHFAITVFLHVFFAIVAVGTNMTYLVLLWWSRRQPDLVVYALKTIRMLDSRLANPAYMLVLLTGFVMVFTVPFPLTTPWILSGLVLYVVIAVLGIAVYAPAFRRQMQIAVRDGIEGEAYQRAARFANILLGAVALLAALIVFLMVVKPPLWAA